MILIIVIAAAVLLIGIMAFLIQGAPNVASNDADITNIIGVAQGYGAHYILDLGCGNGNVVMALAQAGFQVDGVEIQPRAVRIARRRITRAGLNNRTSIIRANMWQHDTAPYDAVVLYAIPHAMARLERKLMAELRPGSLIISNYFVFPNLVPIDSVGRVQVYRVPKSQQ